MKTMKYLTLLLLFFSWQSFSQVGTIVPLETIDEVENGTYIKDIYGDFNPYIGTWEAINDNKKFTLVIEKKEHQLVSFPDGSYYYQDYLVAKYQWVDLASSALLSSTMSATSFEDFKITCGGNPVNNKLTFFFTDDDSKCGHRMEITVRLKNNETRISFIGFYGQFSSTNPFIDCPYANINDIPVPFPINGVNLDKL